MWNLIRWVSPRTIKETFVPPTDYRYPFLAPDDDGATGRAAALDETLTQVSRQAQKLPIRSRDMRYLLVVAVSMRSGADRARRAHPLPDAASALRSP